MLKRRVAAPIVTFLVLTSGWELAVRAKVLSSFLVPAPTDIWSSLLRYLSSSWSEPSGFYYNMRSSIAAAGVGLLVGVALGVILAVAVSESRVLDRLFRPYVVGMQGIPKSALAPILALLFGFSAAPKIILVVMLTMFPVWSHTLDGLHSVPPERIALLRLFRASRLRIFWRVKLPSALPQFFVGLNLAAVISLVGVIVFEFVGSESGLGVLVLLARAKFDLAGMFALFVLLSLIGLALYYLTIALARRVVYWHTDNA